MTKRVPRTRTNKYFRVSQMATFRGLPWKFPFTSIARWSLILNDYDMTARYRLSGRKKQQDIPANKHLALSITDFS